MCIAVLHISNGELTEGISEELCPSRPIAQVPRDLHPIAPSRGLGGTVV